MARRDPRPFEGLQSPVSPPAYAAWKPSLSQTDRAFLAGASLAHLDAFWGRPVAYRGALGERLVLKAAAASLRSAGRPEDEDSVRDHWWLRHSDDVLSPAASTFRGWLMLTQLKRGWHDLSAERMSAIAELLGRGLQRPPEETLLAIDDAIRTRASPLSAAIEASARCFEAEPNEALSHLVADAVLAARFGWAMPLPLIAAHIASPVLRAGGTRRRAIPSDTAWGDAVTGAYAMSAATVIELAQSLSHRADRLLSAAPTLRAKAADTVVAAILAHACLAGSSPVAGMSGRGMRRLFDRLVAAGALRELSGRATFRLYGL